MERASRSGAVVIDGTSDRTECRQDRELTSHHAGRQINLADDLGNRQPIIRGTDRLQDSVVVVHRAITVPRSAVRATLVPASTMLHRDWCLADRIRSGARACPDA
jgi:hypothetical protein